ncbi:TPA: fimbrial protein [Escherichia coli]
MKNIFTCALAISLASFGACAANQGQGSVNFKGTVINAPCGIAPDKDGASVDVDFGQISKSHLENDGISVKKDLNIKLVNCDPNNTVKVTFTGATINGAVNELGTAGNTGTAVVISGQDGKLVQFGSEGAAQSLKEGENTLRYSSWVKKATGGTVKEGDFTAVANFNLTYN